MANPYLEVQSGAEAKRYELEIGVDDVVVGRSTDCQWVISSGAVSRRHARIRRQSGEITIEDLGSSNGTFVNGERLSEPKLLHDDDAVKFGSVEARFFVPATKVEADATMSLAEMQATVLAGAAKAEPSPKTAADTMAPAPPAAPSPTATQTGTGTTPSMPTRVEPAPSSETSVRPMPTPAQSSQPAAKPASAARAASAGPSFVELAVIAAGSFIVVFGLGAILVRFGF